MLDPLPATRLVLTDDSLGSLSVDMQAFFEFSFELAESLEDLVEGHRSTKSDAPQRRRLQP